MENWIGKVVKDGRIIAVLLTSGKWKTPNRIDAAYLNAKFSPFNAWGVDGVMPFGRMAVSRAAPALGGMPVFANPLPPLRPGAVS